MDMPKPGAPQRELTRLVGIWIAEERLSPSPWDPNGGTAVGRVSNRSALDGFAVVQDYEQERNGVVTFRGHGVFRWDPASSTYVLHWFDSMGMPPSEFRGHFTRDTLTLANAGPQSHSRAIFDLSEEGRYRYQMEVSPDGGQWYPFVQGTYVRQG